MAQHLDFEAFMAKYVNPNIPPGGKPFDDKLMQSLLQELAPINNSLSNKRLGLHVLVAICCAQKRADLVPYMFQALYASKGTPVETAAVFEELRETIMIIWPFIGIPLVAPAFLGLSGVLRTVGLTALDRPRQRSDFDKTDVKLGTKTRKDIYKASANSEVFDMLETYFGDFAYIINSVAFGYSVGRESQVIFSLPESELILATSIMSLGATRQAGSHLKACIGFGVSESDIELVVRVARKFAGWQGLSLLDINLSALAMQAREALRAVSEQ